MKFYFTFGLVNQPFTGGWVVINADSRAQACMLFRAAFQPDDEMLNCCGIYEEREFKRTKMYRENDNFGSACHCELSLKIEKKIDRRVAAQCGQCNQVHINIPYFYSIRNEVSCQ